MTLHGKINVGAKAITKILEYYNSFVTNFDRKSHVDPKVYAKLEEFLGSLKESFLKSDTSSISSVAQVSLS